MAEAVSRAHGIPGCAFEKLTPADLTVNVAIEQVVNGEIDIVWLNRFFLHVAATFESKQ